MIDVSTILAWSAWQPLLGCWRGGKVPSQPGLYRIRRTGREDLDYLGQTGIGTMTLRKRLGMLKGIYGATMPYRAPHTAGPALSRARQWRVGVWEESAFRPGCGWCKQRNPYRDDKQTAPGWLGAVRWFGP
jgi:hypothetical protein